MAGFAKSATLPFIGLGVAAVASAKGVEDAFNTILRQTGATGKAASGLEDSFKRVAANTPASLGTVAETMATLSQRTGLTGKSLEQLTLQVVTFNRITKDAPVSVVDLTKALASFNIPGAKMGQVLDQLFVTSQKTGVPLSELVQTLQTAGPIVRQFGFPISTAAGLLATLNKAGVDAGPTIAGLRKAFTTFAKEGKEPKAALEGVLTSIQKFIKAGDIAGARQLGVKIFGPRGSSLVDAAVSGKLSLDSLKGSLDTTGPGILKTAAATSTFSAKLGILKNQAQLALAELGKPVLTILTNSLKVAIPILAAVFGAFASLPGPVQSFAVGLVAVGAAVGPVTKLAKAVKVLGSNTVTAAKTFGKIVSSVVQFGRAALVGAINIARQTAAFVAQKAALIASAIATKALAVAQGILNIVMDANPVVLLVAAIVALGVGIFIAYKKFKPFRDVVDAVGRALLAVFNFVREHWKLILVLLVAPFLAVPLILKKFGPQIVSVLSKVPALLGKVGIAIMKGLLQGLKIGLITVGILFVGIPVLLAAYLAKAVFVLAKKGVEIIAALVRGFVSALPSVASFFLGLPAKIAGFIRGAGTFLVSKGIEIVTGLIVGFFKMELAIAQFWIGVPARIIAALGVVVNTLIPKGIELVFGFLIGVVRAFVGVVKFFVALPGRIIGALGNLASALIPAGIQILGGLLTGLGDKAIELFRFFTGLPGQIVTWIGDLGSILYNAGRAIIGGLIDGIKSMFSAIGDAVGSVAGFITDHFPNSPRAKVGPLATRTPQSWGRSIGAGLQEGLNSALPDLRKTLDVFAGSITATTPVFTPRVAPVKALTPAHQATAAAGTSAPRSVINIENLHADGVEQVGKVIADQQRRQYLLSTL